MRGKSRHHRHHQERTYITRTDRQSIMAVAAKIPMTEGEVSDICQETMGKHLSAISSAEVRYITGVLIDMAEAASRHRKAEAEAKQHAIDLEIGRIREKRARRKEKVNRRKKAQKYARLKGATT
jgi:hypothetical protein